MIATFVAGQSMGIALPASALYTIAGMLLVYNFVLYDLLILTTNMLFNAVKYTHPGGRIDVHVTHNGMFVEVSIADTGIGIPDADLPHIFQEFYRADNARAIERDGTGLGLAFAKQVVERHGGQIWARNNPTAGAVFTLA